MPGPGLGRAAAAGAREDVELVAVVGLTFGTLIGIGVRPRRATSPSLYKRLAPFVPPSPTNPPDTGGGGVGPSNHARVSASRVRPLLIIESFEPVLNVGWGR